MVLKRILASSPRLDSCKMPFEGLPYSGIFEEFSVKFLVYYPLYPDFFVLLKRLWIIVPIRRYWTKAERSTMRTELHTRSMHSCPSGSGNFFVWLFSCLSSVELSIFKTNNLRIRKGLLPPEIHYVSISYAEASHRCARRHTKHFLCPYAACAVSMSRQCHIQISKPSKRG